MKKNHFLISILLIQFLIIELTLFDSFNIYIKLLLGVISCFYYLFIPGSLIIRILNLNKLNIVERISLKVGISIATLMIMGFILNISLIQIGIENPISKLNLLISFSLLIIFLCILCYLKADKNFESSIKFSKIIGNMLINYKINFVILLIIMSIIGTFILNYYHTNYLLILLILFICLIYILIALDKIENQYYPIIIFSVSLALLFHNTLISSSIWGGDIQFEYSLANLVLQSGFWDYTLPSHYNGMLSVVMLAPILSIMGDIDLNWVFKIIYPFIFALVPVILYNIFIKQTTSKISVLSSLFFVSLSSFFFILPQIGRQMVAELFFSLLILLIISKNLNGKIKSFFLIYFGLALVISHYALSYLFIFYLVIMGSIIFLGKNYIKRTVQFNWKHNTFIIFFIILAISWYIYTSSSLNFQSILNLVSKISSYFLSDLLNPQSVQGLDIIMTGAKSNVSSLTFLFYLFSQVFITIGIISQLFIVLGKLKRIKNLFNFSKEYLILAFASYSICIIAIIVPFFAQALDTVRLYHIALFILSPYFIIGIIISMYILKQLIKSKSNYNIIPISFKISSIFLCIFLLLNSGVIHEISGEDHPFSPVSVSIDNSTDYPLFNKMETIGVDWLKKYRTSKIVYADKYRWLLLKRKDWDVGNLITNANQTFPKRSYIYLGTLNKKNNELLVFIRGSGSPKLVYLSSDSIIDNKNKIFDDGGSEIFM
jgi:uncharacterized membrane protein